MENPEYKLTIFVPINHPYHNYNGFEFGHVDLYPTIKTKYRLVTYSILVLYISTVRI